MHSVLVEDKTITPSKILCVGRNYLEHIQELNNAVPEEMVVFNKPNSGISERLLSYSGERLHYEAEICFVVEGGTYSAVGVGLDLTKRQLQSTLKSQGLPWERAKAFDGSALFSRFLPLRDINVDTLQIELLINCVRVQRGDVGQMMYSPTMILQELQSYTSLHDGDIVMTGTPKGVGEVHQGDMFLCRLISEGDILLEVEWQAQ
ncbi:fumarylacetoacetate hydrolase family protein [Vibrio profundum]|uniref:fumarylacetoacetate hydrolase family protein n=1 Tax=Vibrio profundum TaxID=2910247 RepID=UPI003D0E3EFA